MARTAEGEQFGAARTFGLGFTPWSPRASGALSGKYSRTRTTDPGPGCAGYTAPLLTEGTFAVRDVLERIAGELGTTVAAVALACCTNNGPSLPCRSEPGPCASWTTIWHRRP
ncbi:aldo/keto reductase [Streptomyces sp. NPDC059990]|uniref:aldo/keto reductase n=1 Tax=Streptomyces sp. NPDC059990 TaxID=3347027 RepID=UPI0036757E14